ncbi:MAG: pyrroloquinoline quinone biosynthesis protein PqqB [Deltaproteobacteria bacterium]|nr:pyrroloquinoline quinone biosynthesis protein PqqB [Deltaproteobacteria bacterium]
MRAIVLGSAAGGGFPQWNCGCSGCSAVRAGKPGWESRTQDSVAIAAGEAENDRARFAIVNASPDIHAQIKATPALWPRAPRHTPVGAVLLTNGDMDHVLGLFSLRESQPLAIYATEPVWRALSSSVLFRTLQRFEGQTVFRPLSIGRDVELADAAGEPLGLRVRAFAAPGKLPVHLVGHGAESPEDNIALAIGDSAGGPTLAYAAACARLDGVSLEGHHTVLFDGTFFREDELVRQGLSKAVAKDMAHLPITESMAALASLRARKIYTHINNTNPVLGPTEERAQVEAAGWEVAYDGMEIRL